MGFIWFSLGSVVLVLCCVGECFVLKRHLVGCVSGLGYVMFVFGVCFI